MYLLILFKWTLERLEYCHFLTTFPAAGRGCRSCYLVGDALVALELVSCPVSQVLPVPLLWDLTYRPQHFSVNPQNLLSLQKLRIKHLLRSNKSNCPSCFEAPAKCRGPTGNKYWVLNTTELISKGNIITLLSMKLTQISNQDEAPASICRC